jgi:TonB family protein
LGARAALAVSLAAALCACASTSRPHAAAPTPSLAQLKCIPASSVGYPEEARLQGLYGVTTVRFGIDKDGRVDQWKVLDSDSAVFTKTALQMLQQMQCTAPTDAAGNTVTQQHTADIQFLIYPPCKGLPRSAQAEDVLFLVCGSAPAGTHPTRAHRD